jgi:ABC-type maltose transport system permease subunit
MAAAAMITIPIVILFMLVQKHFVEGLTAGAVKG